MKKLICYFCFIFIICVCTSEAFALAKELKPFRGRYKIREEFDYSVLIYDMTNSVREQIEEKLGEAEAELQMSLYQGELNMPQIKKEIIKRLRKKKVSLMLDGNPGIEVIEYCAAPYTDRLDSKMKEIKKRKENIYLDDALIYMVIFSPHVDMRQFPKDVPLSMVKNAISIAVTRFDNRKWHDEIKDCLQKTGKSNAEAVVACSKEYFHQVTLESKKVLKKLGPYRYEFENLPVLDRRNMEKVPSASGKSYQWQMKEEE